MADRPGRAKTETMNDTDSSLPPPPERPRLRRNVDDKMVAGVAAGLARHFDVDVSLVRLGFVALALFGGSGLLLYLVAWLVVPSDDVLGPTPPPPSVENDPPITAQPMV